MWDDALIISITKQVPQTVPPEFLAALVANESGGNTSAKRFEKNVLFSLWQVLLGRQTAYGSIGRAVLIDYIARTTAAPLVTTPTTLPTDALQRIDGLCTSWGLTQIMGYNIFGLDMPLINRPEILAQPMSNLSVALRLLAEFAHRWQLDLQKDFTELFACWNTGRPDPSKTYDPQYVSNGLRRMAIYKGLTVGAPVTDNAPSTDSPAGN